jgi:hypothetical protein
MPVETRPEPGTHRLGVSEAALTLAIRFARPAAGRLAPTPRRPGVFADRLIRSDRAGPAPDGLGPDVVNAVDPGGFGRAHEDLLYRATIS